MKSFIFAVFDSAAKAFADPFTAPTVEVACRMFRQLVNSEGHQINRYPEDYSLFLIGEFDGATGQLHPQSSPHSLGLAITYMEYKKPSLVAEVESLREEARSQQPEDLYVVEEVNRA